MQNDIELYSKQYDCNGIQIIGREKTDINDLIANLKEWHTELSNIILFPNSLYYFATNNFDSDFYLNDLLDENMEDIKIALDVIIKEPEKFFDEYKQKSGYYNKVCDAVSFEALDEILDECGIKVNQSVGLDLDKAKRNAQQKLCTDFCFGVFGEMLFYAVAENILSNKLILSKVELITAPNTNAHGSDGVFCDEEGKVLYFGEAKFTVNLDAGISQALSSMKDCINRIKLDKNFMLVHKKDLKNGYGHIIDKNNIDEYKCKILIFLLHGVEIDKSTILSKIDACKSKFSKKLSEIEFTIISFPIYDKEHLKLSIAEGVDNYGK